MMETIDLQYITPCAINNDKVSFNLILHMTQSVMMRFWEHTCTTSSPFHLQS